MCETPNRVFVKTLGRFQEVACRKCKQCKDNKINDLVGRCIAESRTSVAAHAVTLTYGRDLDERSITYGEAEHVRAAVLTYSDIQKFMKALKNHGFPCRYLIAGEYGSEKGRSHWHGIIFWKKKVPRLPPYEQRKMFVRYSGGMEAGLFWPHGWTWWSEPTYKDMRYACKYAVEDTQDDYVQTKVEFSRKPPLGNQYFTDLAVDIANAGLAPQTREYTFPEVLRRNGERRKFYMNDGTAHRFVAAWDRAWHRKYGTKHHPPSDLVDRWHDKLEGDDLTLNILPYNHTASPFDNTGIETGEKTKFGAPVHYQLGVKILEDFWGIRGVKSSEFIPDGKSSWYYITPSGDKLIWTKSKKADGGTTWRNLKGEKAHAEFLRKYNSAAQRAIQDGRPGNIKLGELSRFEPSQHNPFRDQKSADEKS